MSMSDRETEGMTRRAMLGTAAASAVAAALGAVSEGARAGAKPAAPAGPARRRFEGKVVAVTGATSGIGRAAAIAFAAEGGKVAFCGRREALGAAVQQEIRAAGGEALYVRADVRKEEDVKAFIDRVVQQYGRLDVALNNAGITIEKSIHELSAAEWDDVLHTNLRGVFYAMKHELPHMIAAGGGNVVVTSSSNAIATSAKRGAYAASKRGLIALVQAAALDYGKQGIRVNALVPGTTDTALVRRVAGMENVPDLVWKIGAAQWGKSNVPGLGRMATPQEIAAAALGLASDDYPYMTGAAFVVDGGKTAHGG